MKTLALILLSTIGCTSTKTNIAENSIVKNSVAAIQEDKRHEIKIEDITVKRNFDKTDAEMMFKIKKIVQKDEALIVSVSYSGGCVDNHIFELYSTGKADKNGVVDLFLLHKTTGDLCKMLIMQDRIFDISKLTKRNNFESFRINGSEIQTVNKTK